MSKQCSWLSFACLAAGLALVAGCSDGEAPTYPVSGQVVYSDGTPLPGGLLILESMEGKQKASPRATIGEGGKFQLITPPQRKGVEAGKYKVMVQAFDPAAFDDERTAAMRQPPRLIHPRYEQFASSDLEIEVEPKDNDITIRVDRPR